MPLLLFLPFQIIPYLPLCTTHHALLPFLSFDLPTAVLLILTSAFLSLIRFHSFLSSFLVHASTFLYVFLLSFSSIKCLIFHSKYSFYFFSLAVSDQISFFVFLHPINIYYYFHHWLVCLIVRSLALSFIRSCVRLFIHPFIIFRLKNILLIYLFIHSFAHVLNQTINQSITQSINPPINQLSI